MSTWLLWIILSAVTGSPLLAALALIVIMLVTDRFALGLMPDGWRWFLRRRREGKLERNLLGNPHDRQSRRELAELQPNFRVGELDLAVGRARLLRKDFKGARDSLERAVKTRAGTVEGRVLLARSLTGLGDEPAAALMRDAAWNEYVAAPRFQRRRERLWAWRARPSRPATYGILLAMVLVLFGRFAAPAMAQWSGRNTQSQLPEPVDE